MNEAIRSVLRLFDSKANFGITYGGNPDRPRFFLQGMRKYRGVKIGVMVTDPSQVLDVAAERKRRSGKPLPTPDEQSKVASHDPKAEPEAQSKGKRPLAKATDEFSDDSIDE
jgi:hypothetical protein